MLPTKKKIGILGGGQLGKMLIEASRPWNINNTILEADLNCPAALVADKVILGNLYDADKIREIASEVDVLTYEIEHVNTDVLLALEAEGLEIIPSPRILQIIQDKGLQKQFFEKNSIPSAQFKLVAKNDEFVACMHHFTGEKVVLKFRTGGYDGKGVLIVKKEDLIQGKVIIDQPCLIEQYHENIVEYAVIVARGKDGESVSFPSIEMYFNPITNLVEFLFSPTRMDEKLDQECRKIAMAAIEAFNGPGLFAVELFVDQGGEVLVNEIAPRPHNSGHHTIEGCYTSQFEQLNRILLGFPLGSTQLIQPAAMLNLVGPENFTGEYVLTNTEDLLAMEGVYIHLYNKNVIKPNRKMGHITILAETLDEVFLKAEKVRKWLTFKSV